MTKLRLGLIAAPMLERFMAGDREIGKLRRRI